MCGICGIYHYGTGEPVDERLLGGMAMSLIHRGPDDDGFLVDGPLGLGVRRLSIIDLEGGSQPIWNERGTVAVVQNGEIYNYRELRRELEGYGHVFRTNSDTEAIVHAYEQWGVAGLARLNGMYGIALWDADRQALVIARDPFGIKPLYHWDDGRTLRFGSEIRAILCSPDVRREVDSAALEEYVRHTYVPAPRTAFAGIGKLLPGHALVYDEAGGRLERFHSMVPTPRTQISEPELVAELQDAIETAIKRQMVADVPIGAMLSGGIDSATVAAVMTEHAGGPIDTFTVGFGGGFEEDELEQARATAGRLGSRHHELLISPEEYADFLPHSIWHLEEPVATTSTLAFHRVSALAREHVKVVLTGQGADEAFAGYPRHLGERYGHLYRAMPAVFRDHAVAPLIGRLPRNERLKRAVRSLGIADRAERMRDVYDVVDERLEGSLLRNATRNGAGGGYEVWQKDVTHLNGLDAMLYVDARTSLADNLLLYGDKMSMAVSLEARVPFLDIALMQLAESLPGRLKINGFTQKHILKKAIARWVPHDVIARKKVGFATPVDAWLRGKLRASVEERLLAEGSASRQYFRPETIRRVLDEHTSGRHDHKRILFAILTFELWHEQFIAPTRWHASSAVPSSTTRPSPAGERPS
jgi:asparagine synthase (glutamine-hydrolysing)